MQYIRDFPEEMNHHFAIALRITSKNCHYSLSVTSVSEICRYVFGSKKNITLFHRIMNCNSEIHDALEKIRCQFWVNKFKKILRGLLASPKLISLFPFMSRPLDKSREKAFQWKEKKLNE